MYVFDLLCFGLYLMGMVKRQTLVFRKVVPFDAWHVVFCMTTVPMVFFLFNMLSKGSYGSLYTLWLPPVLFHITNIIDLRYQLAKHGRK